MSSRRYRERRGEKGPTILQVQSVIRRSFVLSPKVCQYGTAFRCLREEIDVPRPAIFFCPAYGCPKIKSS